MTVISRASAARASSSSTSSSSLFRRTATYRGPSSIWTTEAVRNTRIVEPSAWRNPTGPRQNPFRISCSRRRRDTSAPSAPRSSTRIPMKSSRVYPKRSSAATFTSTYVPAGSTTITGSGSASKGSDRSTSRPAADSVAAEGSLRFARSAVAVTRLLPGSGGDARPSMLPRSRRSWQVEGRSAYPRPFLGMCPPTGDAVRARRELDHTRSTCDRRSSGIPEPVGLSRRPVRWTPVDDGVRSTARSMPRTRRSGSSDREWLSERG